MKTVVTSDWSMTTTIEIASFKLNEKANESSFEYRKYIVLVIPIDMKLKFMFRLDRLQSCPQHQFFKNKLSCFFE